LRLFVKNPALPLATVLLVVNLAAVLAATTGSAPPSPQAVNEKKAVAVLRDFFRKQSVFKQARHMDEDQDGRGEYASIGELSGLINLVRNGVGVAAPLNPPLLPIAFQTISLYGDVTLAGYQYGVYLPNANIPPGGLRDVAGGGPSPNVDPNHCEKFWCAYAWPVVAGQTGTRAFFVNQNGVVYQTPMNVVAYSGSTMSPSYFAAFLFAGMDAPVAPAPWPGCDGNTWSRVP
jgi:hypothetical protein